MPYKFTSEEHERVTNKSREIGSVKLKIVLSALSRVWRSFLETS